MLGIPAKACGRPANHFPGWATLFGVVLFNTQTFAICLKKIDASCTPLSERQNSVRELAIPNPAKRRLLCVWMYQTYAGKYIELLILPALYEFFMTEMLFLIIQHTDFVQSNNRYVWRAFGWLLALSAQVIRSLLTQV